MAEGKFYLRPSRDIDCDHYGIPENSNLYRLISEDVCDEDATFIYAPAAKEETPQFSQFALSGSRPANSIKITNVKILYNATSVDTSLQKQPTIMFTVHCVDESFSTNVKDVFTYESIPNEQSFPDDLLVESINKYIKVNGKNSFPELSITVRTVNGYDKSKGSMETIIDYTETRISQIYLEVQYEEITNIGIHRKVGGVVKAATAAYRKLGGSWVEVTEEEAKGVLKNNIITEGKT